jgi:uncharacterized BrkB/YihY/UPF0761 family membrane protein
MEEKTIDDSQNTNKFNKKQVSKYYWGFIFCFTIVIILVSWIIFMIGLYCLIEINDNLDSLHWCVKDENSNIAFIVIGGIIICTYLIGIIVIKKKRYISEVEL